ncbi:MAG TPA: DUF4340 domain-containing protein [Gemmataceae bacterium]|nr:DUF4340 domain-containing protein [Gemmataceae bacterium]
MKLRTIYILFGVLAVMVALFAWAMWNATPQPDLGLFALPSAHGKYNPFEVADVDRVEIKRVRPKEETIVFIKDPKTSRWEIDQPHKLRAGPAVADLVREVLDAAKDPQADERNLKDAGLEPPAATITLAKTTSDKKGGPRSVELDVGEVSSKSSQAVIYVTSPERPKDVLPIPRSQLSAVLDTLNDFRDPYLLASSSSDYTRVKLTHAPAEKSQPTKGPVELTKMDDGAWRYTDTAGYNGSAEMGDAAAVLEPGKRPSGVNGLLKVLSDLGAQPGDWVADGGPELLTNPEYGLDASKFDVLTIDVDRILAAKEEFGADKDKKSEETKAPMTLLVALGKKVGDKQDRYYAAVQEPDHGVSVVRIPTSGPDSIAQELQDPTGLRSKTLVALGGFKKPLAVRVTYEPGKQIEFLRLKQDDPWRMFRDGKEITPDQSAVDFSLVNQMSQADQVRSFVDSPDDTKLGLTPQSPMVELWTDGVEEEKKPEEKKDDKKDDKKDEKKDEPKPRLLINADKANKPAARLTYGMVEGDLAVIKRYADHGAWNETAVVKVPKLLEEQAKAGPLTYYDKTLPKFGSQFELGEVVGLELVRPDGDYVLSRYRVVPALAATTVAMLDSPLGQGPLLTEAVLVPGSVPDPLNPDSPWTFQKPDSADKDYRKLKAGAMQVDDILLKLVTLRAKSLVAETPDDLDKYGLKTPLIKAVVTKQVGDKTETYTYLFGQKKPDDPVYCQQSQRPMVFEVENKVGFEIPGRKQQTVLDALNQDLRDRTVFAVDPTKVKTLTLTQVFPNLAAPVAETYEKAGEEWKAKPEFNVDSSKVTAFAQALAHLSAGDILAPEDLAKIKPAFDQDADKNALTIDMVVEGEAKPLQLRVVKLGDKAVAAGLPADKKGLYALSPNSPSLPGVLFPAPPGVFEGPMEGSDHFKKQ